MLQFRQVRKNYFLNKDTYRRYIHSHLSATLSAECRLQLNYLVSPFLRRAFLMMTIFCLLNSIFQVILFIESCVVGFEVLGCLPKFEVKNEYRKSGDSPLIGTS